MYMLESLPTAINRGNFMSCANLVIVKPSGSFNVFKRSSVASTCFGLWILLFLLLSISVLLPCARNEKVEINKIEASIHKTEVFFGLYKGRQLVGCTFISKMLIIYSTTIN